MTNKEMQFTKNTSFNLFLNVSALQVSSIPQKSTHIMQKQNLLRKFLFVSLVSYWEVNACLQIAC